MFTSSAIHLSYLSRKPHLNRRTCSSTISAAMALSSSASSDTNFGERIRNTKRGEDAPRNTTRATSSTSNQRHHQTAPGAFQFDILSWYPKYQSCQRFFLDHAQHDMLVQAFASFINILLPFQRQPNPIYGSTGARTREEHQEHREAFSPAPDGLLSSSAVSLIPYVRRLVATGMDVPQVLHGFFGNDWVAGIGPQREQERRNYLFAAKSGGWASVKRDYDMLPLETVPFLRPLHDPTEAEIEAAEKTWSEWLALEDWMVGARAPR